MGNRIQESGYRGQGRQSTALPALAVLLLLFAAWGLLPSAHYVKAAPAGATNVQPRPVGVVTDSPAITISTATATTSATPTTSAHEAQIQWTFGAVSGTYASCTVQAKTSYDGTNYLTLGAPASVTVTSGAVNAWTLIEQLGTGSVTTSAVSSTAALGFGQATEFAFSCTSYGTAAPVTVADIYR